MSGYNKRYNIVLPDGTSEQWTQDMILKKGNALFTQHPDANVTETEDFDENREYSPESVFDVSANGQTEQWTSDMWKQKGKALRERYPDAQVSVSTPYTKDSHSKAVSEDSDRMAMQMMAAGLKAGNKNIQGAMGRISGVQVPETGKMAQQFAQQDAMQSFQKQMNYDSQWLEELRSYGMTDEEAFKYMEDTRKYEQLQQSYQELQSLKDRKRGRGGDVKGYVNEEIEAKKTEIAKLEEELKEFKAAKNQNTAYDFDAEISVINGMLGDTGSYGDRFEAIGKIALQQEILGKTLGKQMGSVINEMNVTDEDVYAVARELYNQAQDIILQPSKTDKNKLGKSFVYEGKIRKDDPTTFIPGSEGAMDLVIRSVAEKLQAAGQDLNETELDAKDLREVLTEAEATAWEAFVAKTYAEVLRQKDTPFAVTGAAQAYDMIPFMLEIMVAKKISGEVAGKGGLKRNMEAWLKKGLRKAVNNMSRKGTSNMLRTLGNVGADWLTSLPGRLAESGVAAMLAPSTKDAVGRRMVEVDETGKLRYTRQQAELFGVLDNFKEMFTETAGEEYGKWLGILGKGTGITDIFNKYVTSKIDDIGKDWIKFAIKGPQYLTSMGINNAGEILEEVEGALIDRIAGDKDAWNQFWQEDNLLGMLIGFGPMAAFGLVGGGVNAGINHYMANKITDAERQFREAHSQMGWSETGWKKYFDNLRAQVNGESSIEDVAGLLKQFENEYMTKVIGNDSSMTDEEKIAHLESAQALGSALLEDLAIKVAEREQLEAEKLNFRNVITRNINPDGGTAQFWQTDESGEERVTTGVMTDPVTKKPVRVYVVSQGEELGVITDQGKSMFVAPSAVKNMQTYLMDDYLEGIALSARNYREQTARNAANQSFYSNLDKAFNDNMPMSFDIDGMQRQAVFERWENGQVVVKFSEPVTYNGQTGEEIVISPQEAGRALQDKVTLENDERESLAKAYAHSMAMRTELNNKFRGRGVTIDGKTYRFSKIYEGIHKNEKGNDAVYAIVQDETGKYDRKEVEVTELETQAPSVFAPIEKFEDGASATIPNLPMKTLEDGSQVVDEKALLDTDLEAWARYHDSIIGDDGADTFGYLSNVLANDLAQEIQTLEEGLRVERDFDARADIRAQINDKTARLDKVMALKAKYIAAAIENDNSTGVNVIYADATTILDKMIERGQALGADPKEVASAVGTVGRELAQGTIIYGFYETSTDSVYCMVDNAYDLMETRSTFMHEQQHKVTRSNGLDRMLVNSFIQNFNAQLPEGTEMDDATKAEAVSLIRQRLIGALHALGAGSFYDGYADPYSLADEVISHAREVMFKSGKETDIALREGGLNDEEIINFVKSIENETIGTNTESIPQAGNTAYAGGSDGATDSGNEQAQGTESTAVGGQGSGPLGRSAQPGEYESVEEAVSEGVNALLEGTSEQPVFVNGELIADKDRGTVRFSATTYRGYGNVPATRPVLVRYAIAHGRMDLVDKLDSLLVLHDDLLGENERTGRFETYARWSDTAVVLDENGNPAFSIIKKNGEYSLNLDASTNCKKREFTDAILNDLIKAGLIDKYGWDDKDVIALKDIITKHGLEVACAICFVDARRYASGKMSQDFARAHNMVLEKYLLPGSGYEMSDLQHFNFSGDTTIPENPPIDVERLDWSALQNFAKTVKPTTRLGKIANALLENHALAKVVDAADFLSTIGREGEVVAGAEGEYSQMIYNTWGASIAKRSEPQAQNLHQVLSAKGPDAENMTDKTILNGEWVDAEGNPLFGDDEQSRYDIYLIGGVRLQSFSDAQPYYWFDDSETLVDLDAKGLGAHKYTKELWNAKLFGLTNLKQNLSAVPRVIQGVYAKDNRFGKKGDPIAAGLDENGELSWADNLLVDPSKDDMIVGSKQSIDVKGSIEVHHTPGYSGNTGVIGVGTSAEQIIAMQESDDYSQIIGYHASQNSAERQKATGLEGSHNYEDSQHERAFESMEQRDAWIKGEVHSEFTKGLGKSFKSRTKAIGDWNYYEALARYASMASKGTIKPTEIVDKATKEYLDLCWDRQVLPEFDQFAWMRKEEYKGIEGFRGELVFGEDGKPVMRPGFYKHLTDYCIVDGITGEYAPQLPINFRLPTDEDAFGSFEYILKDGLDGEDAVAENKALAHDAVLKEMTEYLENRGVHKVKYKAESRSLITPAVREEMAQIEALARLNDTYLKAPNGADTKLTPEQWSLVRTKNFKDWFGDWENDPENASKVVDENGEPGILYHGGTFGKEAQDYDGGMSPDSYYTWESGDSNGWFATSERYARYYERYNSESSPIRVFVNVRNVFPMGDTLPLIIEDGVPTDIARDYANRLGVDVKTIVDLIDWDYAESDTTAPAFAINRNPEFAKLLMSRGFDGAADVEADGSFGFMVTKPNQIKSATDNNGAYSAENDDIRFKAVDISKATMKPGVSLNSLDRFTLRSAFNGIKDTTKQLQYFKVGIYGVNKDNKVSYDFTGYARYVTINLPVREGKTWSLSGENPFPDGKYVVEKDGKNYLQLSELGDVMQSILSEVADYMNEDRSSVSFKAAEADFTAAIRQSYTSRNTSLKQVASAFSKIDWKEGTTNLDLGGGKFDEATFFLESKGVENLVFDPFNRSAESNRAIAERVKSGGVDTVTCNNCLNVIDTEGARDNVILQASKALKPGGVAYFSFYDGNKSGVGRQTGKDQWQESRKADSYIPEIQRHFAKVEKKKGMLVASEPIPTSQKSVWMFDDSFDGVSQIAFKANRNIIEKNSRSFKVEGTSDVTERDKKYGVGKRMAGGVYFHKDYAADVLPEGLLEKAEALLPEGFKYNALYYEEKKPAVLRFDEAPDFDTAREPKVGDICKVNTETGEVTRSHSEQIWHHKWEWVKDDYTGFDVQASYDWSKQWKSGFESQPKGIGSRRVWDEKLREAGLPVDRSTTVMFSAERKGIQTTFSVEYPSSATPEEIEAIKNTLDAYATQDKFDTAEAVVEEIDERYKAEYEAERQKYAHIYQQIKEIEAERQRYIDLKHPGKNPGVTREQQREYDAKARECGTKVRALYASIPLPSKWEEYKRQERKDERGRRISEACGFNKTDKRPVAFIGFEEGSGFEQWAMEYGWNGNSKCVYSTEDAFVSHCVGHHGKGLGSLPATPFSVKRDIQENINDPSENLGSAEKYPASVCFIRKIGDAWSTTIIGVDGEGDLRLNTYFNNTKKTYSQLNEVSLLKKEEEAAPASLRHKHLVSSDANIATNSESAKLFDKLSGKGVSFKAEKQINAEFVTDMNAIDTEYQDARRAILGHDGRFTPEEFNAHRDEILKLQADWKQKRNERIRQYNDEMLFAETEVEAKKDVVGKPDSKRAERLFAAAKEVFGTTNDLREAGYIVPDGSLIDLSDKKNGGERGRRNADHRDIAQAIDDRRYATATEYMDDFINEGAIRIAPETGLVSLANMPTDKQREQLYNYLYKHVADGIEVEILEGSKTKANPEYRPKTSPVRIMSDIVKYFNEGAVPTGNVSFKAENRSQKMFVSNAVLAVEMIPQGKATPAQWLGMIQSKGGLKAGEDKWLGLTEWLNASDKKTLTKEEVLGFINENMIQIEETRYAEDARILSLDDVYEESGLTKEDIYNSDEYRALSERFEVYDEESDSSYIDKDAFHNESRANEDLYYGFSVDYWGEELVIDNEAYAALYLGLISMPEKKHTDERPIEDVRLEYTTDGLENKREIALTVPAIEPYKRSDTIHFGDAGEGRAVAWIRFGESNIVEKYTEDEIQRELDALGTIDEFKKIDGSRFVAKRDLYIPKNHVHYADAIVDYGDRGWAVMVNSSHMGGLFATVEEAYEKLKKELRYRLSRRTNVLRTLVIDEIQSKRHQDGRDKGYKKNDSQILKEHPELKHWDDMRKEAEKHLDEIRLQLGDSFLFESSWTDEQKEQWNHWRNNYNYAEKGRNNYLNEFGESIKKERGEVPDAPFEKNWHELAMKRMLRLAAEEGYDRVAWTNGGMQAERYDIGAVIKSIEYNRDLQDDREGQRAFYLYDSDGWGKQIFVDQEGIIRGSYWEELKDKPLNEAFGKGLADKMMAMQKGETLDSTAFIGGGEGMSGFYDRMLPAFMNKYGKKWGVKVKDMDIPGLGNEKGWHYVDVTPEMRESVMGGQVMFKIGNARKQTMSSQIHNKLTAMTPGQIAETIDTIEKLGEQAKAGGDSRFESTLVDWVCRGLIILPQDSDRAIVAYNYAKRFNTNTGAITNLVDYIDKTSAKIEEREADRRPLNPDEEPLFTNRTVLSDAHGIVVYDVPDSREGQRAVRNFVDSHFGRSANPWCLITRQDDGDTLDKAWNFWQNYRGAGRKIAFQNGKLIAFMSSSDMNEEWWDRLDRPHSKVPVYVRFTTKDGLKVSAQTKVSYTDADMLEYDGTYTVVNGNVEESYDSTGKIVDTRYSQTRDGKKESVTITYTRWQSRLQNPIEQVRRNGITSSAEVRLRNRGGVIKRITDKGELMTFFFDKVNGKERLCYVKIEGKGIVYYPTDGEGFRVAPFNDDINDTERQRLIAEAERYKDIKPGPAVASLIRYNEAEIVVNFDDSRMMTNAEYYLDPTDANSKKYVITDAAEMFGIPDSYMIQTPDGSMLMVNSADGSYVMGSKDDYEAIKDQIVRIAAAVARARTYQPRIADNVHATPVENVSVIREAIEDINENALAPEKKTKRAIDFLKPLMERFAAVKKMYADVNAGKKPTKVHSEKRNVLWQTFKDYTIYWNLFDPGRDDNEAADRYMDELGERLANAGLVNSRIYIHDIPYLGVHDEDILQEDPALAEYMVLSQFTDESDIRGRADRVGELYEFLCMDHINAIDPAFYAEVIRIMGGRTDDEATRRPTREQWFAFEDLVKAKRAELREKLDAEDEAQSRMQPKQFSEKRNRIFEAWDFLENGEYDDAKDRYYSRRLNDLDIISGTEEIRDLYYIILHDENRDIFEEDPDLVRYIALSDYEEDDIWDRATENTDSELTTPEDVMLFWFETETSKTGEEELYRQAEQILRSDDPNRRVDFIRLVANRRAQLWQNVLDENDAAAPVSQPVSQTAEFNPLYADLDEMTVKAVNVGLKLVDNALDDDEINDEAFRELADIADEYNDEELQEIVDNDDINQLFNYLVDVLPHNELRDVFLAETMLISWREGEIALGEAVENIQESASNPELVRFCEESMQEINDAFEREDAGEIDDALDEIDEPAISDHIRQMVRESVGEAPAQETSSAESLPSYYQSFHDSLPAAASSEMLPTGVTRDDDGRLRWEGCDHPTNMMRNFVVDVLFNPNGESLSVQRQRAMAEELIPEIGDEGFTSVAERYGETMLEPYIGNGNGIDMHLVRYLSNIGPADDFKRAMGIIDTLWGIEESLVEWPGLIDLIREIDNPQARIVAGQMDDIMAQWMETEGGDAEADTEFNNRLMDEATSFAGRLMENVLPLSTTEAPKAGSHYTGVYNGKTRIQWTEDPMLNDIRNAYFDWRENRSITNMQLYETFSEMNAHYDNFPQAILGSFDVFEDEMGRDVEIDDFGTSPYGDGIGSVEDYLRHAGFADKFELYRALQMFLALAYEGDADQAQIQAIGDILTELDDPSIDVFNDILNEEEVEDWEGNLVDFCESKLNTVIEEIKQMSEDSNTNAQLSAPASNVNSEEKEIFLKSVDGIIGRINTKRSTIHDARLDQILDEYYDRNNTDPVEYAEKIQAHLYDLENKPWNEASQTLSFKASVKSISDNQYEWLSLTSRKLREGDIDSFLKGHSIATLKYILKAAKARIAENEKNISMYDRYYGENSYSADLRRNNANIRNIMSYLEEEIKNPARLEALKEDGIVPGKIVPFSRYEEIFRKYNTDELDGKIFTGVAQVAKRLGLDIKFTNVRASNTNGQYGMGDGMSTIEIDLIDFYTDKHRLATDMLHELIHSVTAVAMDVRESADDGWVPAQVAYGKFTPKMRSALDDIYKAYRKIKDDPSFEGEYGIETAQEMMSELSNPDFRDKLEKVSMLEQIINGIRKFISFLTGNNEKTNLKDALLDRLTVVINEFPVEAYNQIVNDDRVSPADERAILGLRRNGISFKAQLTRKGLSGVLEPQQLDDYAMSIYENVSDNMRQMIATDAIDKYDGSFTKAVIRAFADLAEVRSLSPENVADITAARDSLRVMLLDDKIELNDVLWSMYREEHKDDPEMWQRKKNERIRRELGKGSNVAPEMTLRDYLDAAAKAKDDIVAQYTAMREVAHHLTSVMEAMSERKAFDRAMVSRLVELADDILESHLLDNTTNGEVKRLLGVIRRATGMRNIQKRTEELYDLILSNQLRNLNGLYEKVMSRKAYKVGSKKVKEQGSLDLQGQQMMEAYREGIGLTSIDEDGNVAVSQVLLDRINDALTDLYGTDKRKSKAGDMRFLGYTLAKRYITGIASSIAKENEAKRILKEAEEKVKAGEMEKKEYNQLERSTKELIRQIRSERIENYTPLIQDLFDYTNASHTFALDFIKRDQDRISAIRHDANADLEGTSDETSQIDPNFFQRLTNSSVMQFFSRSLATFDTMLKAIGRKSANGEGYLWNRFMRSWIDCNGAEFKNFQSACEEMDAKMSEVFDRKMRWSDIYDLEKSMPKDDVSFTDSGKSVRHEFTQGGILYIVLANAMPDGAMKLRNMDITEEQVKKLELCLDPRVAELGRWMVEDFLPSRREAYNEVHERMFGASMSRIPNYFPLVVNKREVRKQVDVGMNEAEDQTASIITNAIIQRTVNALPLDITRVDAFSVLVDNVKKMEHWRAFAEWNRDISDLLSYNRFRNQLSNYSSMYGSKETFLKDFENCARIAASSYRPKQSDADKRAMEIARNVTAAKISLRTYTALKQFLSFPAYFVETNPVYLAESVATAWKSWNWAMENLPVFEKRWKSRKAGDHILSESDNWKSRAVEIAARVGMTPNGFVDAMTVSIGAYAIYRTKLDKYLRDGYDQETAEKRAKQDAVILYNETQQSSEDAFLSAIQKDRSWLTATLTAFRNSSMGYGRMMFNAFSDEIRRMTPGNRKASLEFMIKQLERDGLSPRKAARAAERAYRNQGIKNLARIATFGYLMQFAWNLGSSLMYLLFGDDDDDKQAMLVEASRHALYGGWSEGLPMGADISELINMMSKGEKLSDHDFAALPFVSDVENLAKKYDKGETWAAVNDLVNIAAQMLVGVNPQTIEDFVYECVDFCRGDLGLAKESALFALRVMQVPQSQLDKLYLDDLQMTAQEARELTVNEIAHRYAQYKLFRKAGPFAFAYSDEMEEAEEKKIVDRLIGSLKERGLDNKANDRYLETSSKAKELFDNKVKELEKKAKEGDHDADRELLEIYLSPEYLRYQAFLTEDAKFRKSINKAVNESGSVGEMMDAIDDVNRQKAEFFGNFESEDPAKVKADRFTAYTDGFLQHMAKVDKRYKDEFLRGKSENVEALERTETIRRRIDELEKKRKTATNRSTKSAYTRNINLLKKQLTNLGDESLYIPEDIYSSPSFQTYLKFKERGKLNGNHFKFDDVTKLEESIGAETDEQKRATIERALQKKIEELSDEIAESLGE